jgi:SAM-dependent methyltransferase
MDLVVNLNPSSVLDIGTGFGKYGLLCREYLELWDGRENYSHFLRRIDGVEAFENYITPVHEFVYNHVYVRDILKLMNELNFSYDLILLVDVLEHFNKPEGNMLLKKILTNNKGALISTPKNPSNQKDAFKNIYEAHRARWTKQELSNLASSFFISDGTHLIAYIGRKESVKKLRRKLILRRVKKIPAMSTVIRTYLHFTRK